MQFWTNGALYITNMELGIVILFIVVGLFLEIRYKVHLYHSWRERLFVSVGCFIFLIGWELINHFYFDAWYYPGVGMIGVFLFGLPLELYLFFFTAPYFSFVVYELIHREVDKN